MPRKATYEEPVDYLETEEINEEEFRSLTSISALIQRKSSSTSAAT